MMWTSIVRAGLCAGLGLLAACGELAISQCERYPRRCEARTLPGPIRIDPEEGDAPLRLKVRGERAQRVTSWPVTLRLGGDRLRWLPAARLVEESAAEATFEVPLTQADRRALSPGTATLLLYQEDVDHLLAQVEVLVTDSRLQWLPPSGALPLLPFDPMDVDRFMGIRALWIARPEGGDPRVFVLEDIDPDGSRPDSYLFGVSPGHEAARVVTNSLASGSLADVQHGKVLIAAYDDPDYKTYLPALLRTGAALGPRLDTRRGMQAVALSEDGGRVALLAGGRLEILKVESGTLTAVSGATDVAADRLFFVRRLAAQPGLLAWKKGAAPRLWLEAEDGKLTEDATAIQGLGAGGGGPVDWTQVQAVACGPIAAAPDQNGQNGDGEGPADLAVAVGAEVRVYLNLGGGRWRDGGALPADGAAAVKALAIGRLDGDGTPDIAVARSLKPGRDSVALYTRRR